MARVSNKFVAAPADGAIAVIALDMNNRVFKIGEVMDDHFTKWVKEFAQCDSQLLSQLKCSRFIGCNKKLLF